MEPTYSLLGPPKTSLKDGVKETVEWLRTTYGDKGFNWPRRGDHKTPSAAHAGQSTP